MLQDIVLQDLGKRGVFLKLYISLFLPLSHFFFYLFFVLKLPEYLSRLICFLGSCDTFFSLLGAFACLSCTSILVHGFIYFMHINILS